MIISVDTGNKHMKTENCEFNSGVEILDTLPGELERGDSVRRKILYDNE